MKSKDFTKQRMEDPEFRKEWENTNDMEKCREKAKKLFHDFEHELAKLAKEPCSCHSSPAMEPLIGNTFGAVYSEPVVSPIPAMEATYRSPKYPATPAPSDWREKFRQKFSEYITGAPGAFFIKKDTASWPIEFFIENLLSSQREEIERKVLDEVRDTANLYSGAGESDCEKYNIIRALEERLAELLKDNK